MSLWRAVIWDTARAGGMTAYVLLTVSLLFGLALSLRWYSRSWPRWATTELHRYLTLLALVFTGIHTLAVWLDPYMAFGPGEILIPLASHYRPFWVGLGIVAAYLMIAIWLSNYVQRQIGYSWWRKLHYATFAVYALATIHGIGTGTDTRAPWALCLYIGSALLVSGVLAVRLLLPGKARVPHPRVAVAVAGALVLAVIWTVAGPLRAGWGVAASQVVPAVASSGATRSHLTGGASIATPFTSALSGQVTETSSVQDATIDMTTRLSGGVTGSLHVTIHGRPVPGGSVAIQDSSVTLSPDGGAASCSGAIISANNGALLASCDGAQHLQLDIQVQASSGSAVTGTVQGQTA